MEYSVEPKVVSLVKEAAALSKAQKEKAAKPKEKDQNANKKDEENGEEPATISEFLGQTTAIKKQNEYLNKKVEELEKYEKTLVPTTGEVNCCPSGKNTYPGSNVENNVVNAIHRIKKIKERINENEEKRKKVSELISSVESPKYKALLSARYLDLKTWKDVGNELNYTPQYAKRLHNKILKTLSVPDGVKKKDIVRWD